jgi:hypothetical protein
MIALTEHFDISTPEIKLSLTHRESNVDDDIVVERDHRGSLGREALDKFLDGAAPTSPALPVRTAAQRIFQGIEDYKLQGMANKAQALKVKISCKALFAVECHIDDRKHVNEAWYALPRRLTRRAWHCEVKHFSEEISQDA